jgi:hypothetical protein
MNLQKKNMRKCLSAIVVLADNAATIEISKQFLLLIPVGEFLDYREVLSISFDNNGGSEKGRIRLARRKSAF